MIVVEEPDTFEITSVSTYSDVESYSGECPYTYTYYADITSNELGTITYWFEFEDGSTSTQESLTFDSAGTQTISGTRALSETASYTAQLYIEDPAYQYFDAIDFVLICN